MYSVLVMLTACIQPTRQAEPPLEKIGQAHLIASNAVGPIELGKRVPKSVFATANKGYGYDSYWDSRGYFEGHGLRLIHLDIKDLIVIMSPKHSVHQILVGPSYKTASGISLGTSFKTLKQKHQDTKLQAATLHYSWLYRPDQVNYKESEHGFLGFEHQNNKKALKCAASTEHLPNVRFFFESCDKAQQNGVIEAVLVTNPDDSDLQAVDPFVDMKSVPPCPKARTDDPKALTQEGLKILRKNKMGDYYSTSSVQKGLPILRDAALSGSREAAIRYVNIVSMYIHQDVIGDPLDRPILQGAQEAMLFTLLLNYRSPKPPPAHSCEAILIQFDKPLTPELFMANEENDAPPGACGGQYRFNYFDVEAMEALRKQARAWAKCWPKPPQ